MLVKSKVTAIKEIKSYGHITLNSGDFPGVKDLTLGDKKDITISIDITELRKPSQWDISEERMKPTDVIAGIRILGVTLPMKEKKKEKK
ncbi:hypothetical protein LCGC14_1771780 [marine sediment metagenome]|uniref:Uncharacterized protein n=1 Tax=marine sediment metagenome TaxID=412755 RepID=A0A0F9JCX3_9ZZZZ